MKRSVEKIVSISIVIESKQKFKVMKEDPDDNKILECAFEGKVNYIISQDKDLLRLKNFEGIEIINPEEFLDRLNLKFKE